MPRGADLERMYRNPGSVSRRQLVRAIEERGWELARKARGHDIYAKSGWANIISVPTRLRGTGTIRRLIRELQNEEASRG